MANNAKFAIVTTVLAANVVNGGTFTVSYPSGTSQESFTYGLVGTGHYIVLNNNDTYGDTDLAVSFGAANITITNSSGATWPSSTNVIVYLAQVPAGRNVFFLPFWMHGIFILNGDLVPNFHPGVGGVIEHLSAFVWKSGITATGSVNISLRIGAVPVTGGVLVITPAVLVQNTVLLGTPITGNNILTRESALSVVATTAAPLTAGQIGLLLRIRTIDD